MKIHYFAHNHRTLFGATPYLLKYGYKKRNNIRYFKYYETINLIINLNKEHKQNILEECVNYFTYCKVDSKNIKTEDDKTKYWNKLNVMREILNIIGKFRNSLAHNQPIYNFNVKEYYSTKSSKVNYILPKAKNQHEQHVLTTSYMSYLADFFGSDKDRKSVV